MTVIRWEQRGCGRSCSEGPYDLETALNDIESIRAAYGFDRISIGGHSWGADLSLAYALEHTDRVYSLLYISGTGVQNDREWKEAYENGVGTELDPVPEFEFPWNLEVNKQGVASWRRYIKRPDLLRRVSESTIPGLFIYGERDIRPSWPAEQVARLMRSAEFLLIPKAPHCIWLTHESELKQALWKMPLNG